MRPREVEKLAQDHRERSWDLDKCLALKGCASVPPFSGLKVMNGYGREGALSRSWNFL